MIAIGRLGSLVLLVILLHASSAADAQEGSAAPRRAPDVIFIPSTPRVVDAMLTLAKVGPDDVVYDMGSGDGRIPIAAVQTFNAQSAVGIEIEPRHIAEAKANAAKAGVGHRVTFINADMFTTPIGDATVVTLYLLPTLNVKLLPKLQKELKPGSRVVSSSFDMGELMPDQTVEVDGRTIFLWIIK